VEGLVRSYVDGPCWSITCGDSYSIITRVLDDTRNTRAEEVFRGFVNIIRIIAFLIFED
jgi:hypothetical protein